LGGTRKANLHNAKAHSASRVHARQRLPPERSGEVQGRFGAIIGCCFEPRMCLHQLARRMAASGGQVQGVMILDQPTGRR